MNIYIYLLLSMSFMFNAIYIYIYTHACTHRYTDDTERDILYVHICILPFAAIYMSWIETLPTNQKLSIFLPPSSFPISEFTNSIQVYHPFFLASAKVPKDYFQRLCFSFFSLYLLPYIDSFFLLFFTYISLEIFFLPFFIAANLAWKQLPCNSIFAPPSWNSLESLT